MNKKALLDALDELHNVVIYGNQYAENEGIDIDFNFDLLKRGINGETDMPIDDGQKFEMMASTCEAIRDLADAYGGDKHFNTCVSMALRSCIAALEGLNK